MTCRKKSQENRPKTEKDKTETAIGLDRRTREEIEKSVIKRTALRFQTEGRHQNRRPPFGGSVARKSARKAYTHF